MGPQQQEVFGSGNLSFQAARDLIFGSQNQFQFFAGEGDFHTPELAGYLAPSFATPDVAHELREQLRREKVLLLGGNELSEKLDLARHLAASLQQSLKADGIESAEGTVSCLETLGGLSRARLEAKFEQNKRPTLFLLANAEPFHVDHDLGRLLQRAAQRSHYLVITTDQSAAAWGLGPGHSAWAAWRELSDEQLFPLPYRVALLRDRLLSAGESLPPGLLIGGNQTSGSATEATALIGSLKLGEAVAGLRGRAPVLSLAAWLLSEGRGLTENRVRRQVKLLEADQVAARGWFRRLSERHQLFVVGCLIFNRLFDDQLLAGLDLAADTVWRPRVPSLVAFDYQDFEVLDGYFRRFAVHQRGVLVTVARPPLYRDLLCIVWDLQRRHLLAVMPLLSDLVREAGSQSWRRRHRLGGTFPISAERVEGSSEEMEKEDEAYATEETDESSPAEQRPTISDATAPLSRFFRHGPLRELLGSAPRREQLCWAISASLGQIAHLSIPAVERCLFELSMHGSWEAQAVAASALDNLRGGLREAELRSLLFAWYHGARQRERDLGERAETREVRSQGNIRATVALVILYAALRAAPGTLPAFVLELLELAASDGHPAVRRRLVLQVLPAVVLWHQAQVEAQLRRMVEQEDLRESIAQSWAEAHRVRPQETFSILESWFAGEPAKSSGRKEAGSEEVEGLRRARLATVALVYGYLDYSAETCCIPIGVAIKRLRVLLLEPDVWLRHQVLRAVSLLIRRNFPALKPSFSDLVDGLPLSDRLRIVEPLLSVYRDQRRALKGGDSEMPWGGTWFHVWAESSRPKTMIEEALEQWVCEDSQPILQQISFETLWALATSSFAKDEHQFLELERERREKYRQAAAATENLKPASLPETEPVLLVPGWSETWVLRLLTVGQPRVRKLVSWLTPEAVVLLPTSENKLRAMLEPWHARSDRLGEAGRWLSRFIKWYQHRVLIVVLVGALAASLLAGGIYMWRG